MTTPDHQSLDLLHAFTIQSNTLLVALHAVARLPAKRWRSPNRVKVDDRFRRQWDLDHPDLAGNVLAGQLVPMVQSWFAALDAAYKSAGERERIALADTAGCLPRWADERFLFRETRNPNGLFLRRFEAKQFEVEKQLAALAVAGNPTDQTRSRGVAETGRTLPMSKTDMRNRLGNCGRKKFTTIVAGHDLQPYYGHRQLFTLSLAKMDATMRQKLNAGK